jgi:excisionase family DNA binding protein
METKRLLVAEQVAQLLGVSRSKAYQMMLRKEIPTIKIGKCVRVQSQDLEDFILTHRVTGESTNDGLSYRTM